MFLSLYFVDYQQEPSHELVNALAVIILIINASAIILMVGIIIRSNFNHIKRFVALPQDLAHADTACRSVVERNLPCTLSFCSSASGMAVSTESMHTAAHTELWCLCPGLRCLELAMHETVNHQPCWLLRGL